MSEKLDQLLKGFYDFKKEIKDGFNRLETRMDNLENRFNKFGDRLDSLEKTVNRIDKNVREIKRRQETNRRQIAENTLDISDLKAKTG